MNNTLFQFSDHIEGCLPLHNGGYLNKQHSLQLLRVADRYERTENPRIYCKAIRATLMAMGFSPQWVENEFRDLMESYYERK